MKKIFFLAVLCSSSLSFAQEEVPLPVPGPIIYPEKSEEIIQPEIVTFPTIEAQYPGGVQAINQFILANLQYPTISMENDEQGKVYLEFIVEKDGTLSNISVVRGVSKSLDAEAIRLVKLMPKWLPAEMNDGTKVRSRMRFPFTFSLY